MKYKTVIPLACAIAVSIVPTLGYAQSAASGDDYGTTGAILEVHPNDGTTGTTANKLVKLTSTGNAIITATTDTTGIRGVALNGQGTAAGTTGNVSVAVALNAALLFDGTPTTGDYVIQSTTAAGEGHDSGSASTCPTGSQTIGKVTGAGSGSTFVVALGTWGCSSSGGGSAANIQTFTSSGTWTKPAGVTWVMPVCVGGGGGGGSGSVEASGTAASGGAGGAGAGLTYTVLQASSVGSTVTVTLAGASAGGAAVSAGGSGHSGTVGGNTTFGSLMTAFGGGPGGLGSSTTATGGTPGGAIGAGSAGAGSQDGGGGPVPPSSGVAGFVPDQFMGSYAGSNFASLAGTAGFMSAQAGATGGGGGGLATSPVGLAGGNGGPTMGEPTAPTGGAGGTTTGTVGGAGVSPSFFTVGQAGSGGAGGGSCSTNNCTAGAGGVGGFGSGGGGGGAAIGTGTGSSGAGGTGGAGACTVFSG